jgi:hypothetical protein
VIWSGIVKNWSSADVAHISPATIPFIIKQKKLSPHNLITKQQKALFWCNIEEIWFSGCCFT